MQGVAVCGGAVEEEKVWFLVWVVLVELMLMFMLGGGGEDVGAHAEVGVGGVVGGGEGGEGVDEEGVFR